MFFVFGWPLFRRVVTNDLRNIHVFNNLFVACSQIWVSQWEGTVSISGTSSGKIDVGKIRHQKWEVFVCEVDARRLCSKLHYLAVFAGVSLWFLWVG
jgi:hypothetical protein